MFGAIKSLFGGKDSTPVTEYWVGNIGLTLMVYNNDLEAHVQSDIRRYDYFFKAPPQARGPASAENFQKRLLDVTQVIYQEHARMFREREPNDPNYIAVVESVFRQLSTQDVAAKPWLSAQRPHWEQSHCIALSADAFEKASPNTF